MKCKLRLSKNNFIHIRLTMNVENDPRIAQNVYPRDPRLSIRLAAEFPRHCPGYRRGQGNSPSPVNPLSDHRAASFTDHCIERDSVTGCYKTQRMSPLPSVRENQRNEKHGEKKGGDIFNRTLWG